MRARESRFPFAFLAIDFRPVAPASSQTELLALEFNRDDQAGLELWPTAFAGLSSIANFTKDAIATSGTTTATVTTSIGFDVRGSLGKSLVSRSSPGL